jgi:hypothetical protein
MRSSVHQCDYLVGPARVGLAPRQERFVEDMLHNWAANGIDHRHHVRNRGGDLRQQRTDDLLSRQPLRGPIPFYGWAKQCLNGVNLTGIVHANN